MGTQSNGFLQGKRVVLLGASMGIGLATAKAAAAEGAEVVIVSANSERIHKALTQLPASATAYAVNLANEDDIKAFFSTIGTFDHLVYTAGENLTLHTLSETNLDEAKAFLNVRFWGALGAVKYGSQNINRDGSICLIGGIANLRPGSGWGIASAICGAMDGFTRAMAVELAPIRVNSVVPGVIKTNLWGAMSETDRENFFATTANALPVKRVGQAEDIAQAYVYLMRQQFSTGQTIVVDGGAVLV